MFPPLRRPDLKIPTRQQAEAMLREAAQLNPGPWVDHSRHAALAAGAIAAQHPDLDAEAAYILGCLHDIGRRVGVHAGRHVLDGYQFLSAQGFEDAARICLTHSYPIPNIAVGSDHWDGSDEGYRFVQSFLDRIEYDLYDRLIQLCDTLAQPSGFCLMEKRFVDVVLRYGFNDFTLDKWKAFLAIRKQFEDDLGISIYQLLPGVVENMFR
jgi:hypothetical protein